MTAIGKTGLEGKESMTIEYPFGTASHLGHPVQVCEGVYRLAIPLPEHLGMEHINAWILEDGDGWTLVECGFDCPLARQVWQQVQEEFLGSKPVKRVILTHHHIDHAGLARWVEQYFQARIWVAPEELHYMNQFHEKSGLWGEEDQASYFRLLGFSEAEKKAALDWLGGTGEGMGPLPENPRMISEAERIEINEKEWQVINLRGHSVNQCTLYCEELKVWIAADQLLPGLTTYAGQEPGDQFESDTLGLLFTAIDEVEKLPDDTLVLPAHGAPFYGLHARTEAVKRHYERLFQQLIECCNQPLTAMGVRQELISDPRYYASPFFIIAKLVAALRHLARRGDLICMLDGAGQHRYMAKNGMRLTSDLPTNDKRRIAHW